MYDHRNDRDRSDIEIDLTAPASIRIRWKGTDIPGQIGNRGTTVGF